MMDPSAFENAFRVLAWMIVAWLLLAALLGTSIGWWIWG
jgi:hypothetical protein